MTDASLALPAATAGSHRLRGFLLVLGASIGWSLSGLFTRLLENPDPLPANGARSLGMSLALTLYLLLRFRRDLPARVRAIPMTAYLLVGGFFAIGSTMYIVSYALASVAVVACLGALAPLFSALLAWLLMRERVGASIFVALAIAMVGIVVMGSGEGDFSGAWIGYLVALGVAFFFAAQTVALRRYRAFNLMPAYVAGGVFTTVVLLLVVAGGEIGAHDFWLAMATGVLQLAIPVILFAASAQYLPAVLLSLFALMESLLNPLWVYLAVGETPTLETALGGALILTAVALVLLRRG